MNKRTIYFFHVGDFYTVSLCGVTMRTKCNPSRSCQFSAYNFITGYCTKIRHIEKLDSPLVHLPVLLFSCSAFSKMSGAAVTAILHRT